MANTTYNVEPLRTIEDIKTMKAALYEVGNRSKTRIGSRNRFLFSLGINVGLRVSDLVALKVDYVRGHSYADIIEQKTGTTSCAAISRSL